MGNMVLGDYAFANNPSSFPIPTPVRSAAAVNTVGGVEFLSWGLFVAGKTVELTWSWMTPGQFDSLATVLEADAPVVWQLDPDDDPIVAYNVEVLNLEGEFHGGMASTAHYRKNVRLNLLILSEDEVVPPE